MFTQNRYFHFEEPQSISSETLFFAYHMTLHMTDWLNLTAIDKYDLNLSTNICFT